MQTVSIPKLQISKDINKRFQPQLKLSMMKNGPSPPHKLPIKWRKFHSLSHSLTQSLTHSVTFYQTYLPASPIITLDANSLHTKTPNIKRQKQEISTTVKVEHYEKFLDTKNDTARFLEAIASLVVTISLNQSLTHSLTHSVSHSLLTLQSLR